MRNLSKHALALVLTATMATACAQTEEPTPQAATLTITSATPQAVVASYRAGALSIELRATLLGDHVVSTISDPRGVLTRLELPVALSPELDLRSVIADAAAASPGGSPEALALVPDALAALHSQLGTAAGPALQLGLDYQNELALALRVGPERYRRADLVPDCGEHMASGAGLWHTEAMHDTEATAASTVAGVGSQQQSIYHLACLVHDVVCLGCGHWYCGWECTPGAQCLGRCGGGCGE